MISELEGERPIVILGAGVAGLAAAWKLSALGRRVVVLERAEQIGGLAATVTFGPASLDLGSHRIHPSYFPEALDLLQRLLGDELLRVPRRGFVRLNGRFADYPPSLIDFIGALGGPQAMRCAVSLGASRLRRLTRREHDDSSSYEGHLVRRVGRRAYEIFYAPYVRKLYGLEGGDVSARAARMRITTGSPLTALRQMMPFAKNGTNGSNGGAYFYYPARGFGSIGDALLREATSFGAQVRTGVTVATLETASVGGLEVVLGHGGGEDRIAAAAVVSTIPIAQLVDLIRPAPPEAVREAARALRWRGIRLLQVRVARARCLAGETYYFPEDRYIFGRVSEPSQYSPAFARENETALNLEVICTPGDDLWSLDDETFYLRVAADAEKLSLFDPREVLAHRSLRIPNVYPVYDRAAERNLERTLGWVESIGHLYSIGRGGMFLHANTDHSIYLGLRVAERLAAPGADASGWRATLSNLDAFTVRD